MILLFMEIELCLLGMGLGLIGIDEHISSVRFDGDWYASRDASGQNVG